jgi:putative membrane protein
MLLHWLLTAAVLILIANLVPGIFVSSFGVALLAAAVMGLVNILVRPIVSLLTLPINLLTLGLFSFVINALMFALVAYLVPGFEVTSFWSALIGSLILSVITALLGTMPNYRAGRPV